MVHSSPVLPPLDTLETFARAARLGSFSAAAEEGGVTHGAVSRQISRLERWLGLRLFDRQARGVSLTPEGIRFFGRTQEALSLLTDGEDRWVPRRNKPTVRLSLTPSVASLWLFSRLPQIERDDIHVDLVLEHRLADFGEGAELAIRCGRGPWAGVRATPLWREKSYPIASPSVAARLGDNPEAEAILSWSLIHDSNAEGWRRWLAPDGVEYRPRGQDRRFEDYNLVIDACVQGVGVALARPPLSDAAITSGALVRVSPRSVDYHVSYHLVRQDGALSGPATAIARRLLQATGHAEGDIASFTVSNRAKV